MGQTVIRVEEVSKQYRLGEVSTGTISHDINRWWHSLRGKENPYATIGKTPEKSRSGEPEYVWALRDINFDLKQGEVLGLIGRNGAGKSTLLKILSRTTAPTTGKLKVKGRLASLLEVGTGFHPELSGRENIFLNGAILGMKKHEIKKKFDEIVDFSGVEKYIETPVKRYSSGMYVRLAFAVAAHLESEILIVDEVLAVGDAEFQKKCLGKMGDVSRGEGRTILFVSHNMAAINQLCTTGLVISAGGVVFSGNIQEASNFYLRSNSNQNLTTSYKKETTQNNAFELLEASVVDMDFKEKGVFTADETIIIKLRLAKNLHVPNTQGYFVVKNHADEVFIESDTFDFPPNILDELSLGIHDLNLKINGRVLPNGQFIVYLNFTSELALNGFTLDSPREVLSFEITDLATSRGIHRKARTNYIAKWSK